MTEEKLKTKKRINSKAKGGGFENKVCKILTDALPPMQFRRSQSSGAILGGVNSRFMTRFSNAAASLFVGDVVPTNEEDVLKDHGWKIRFSLECKFYKEADSLDMMFKPNTQIRGWFEQAAADAQKVNKEPLLIFKFNRTETYCGIDSNITKLPQNITSTLSMVYNQPYRAITIFLLKEALNDNEWWKI